MPNIISSDMPQPPKSYEDLLQQVCYIPLSTTLPWVDHQYIIDNMKRYIASNSLPYPIENSLLARFNYIIDIYAISQSAGIALTDGITILLNRILDFIKKTYPDGKECIAQLQFMIQNWDVKIEANVYEGGIDLA